MRSIAALACLWCASVASAQIDQELQPFTPSSIDYPDRAAALRPAGLGELSLSWSHGTGFTPRAWEEHLVFQGVELRVPYESAIFEASWVGVLEHYHTYEVSPPDKGLIYRFGNPRLGASWRRQGDRFRVEVGGALNLAWLHAEVLDPIELPSGYLGGRPPFAGPTSYLVPDASGLARYRGGWNSFLLGDRQFALIAHARVELDLGPEAVLGAELDIPLVVHLSQSHFMLAPQLAIEGAWRFLAHAMLGVRGQVVMLSLPDGAYGFAMSLEPFLRVGFAEGDVVWYGLLAALVYLGPQVPYGPVDPRGSIAPKLGAGILF